MAEHSKFMNLEQITAKPHYLLGFLDISKNPVFTIGKRVTMPA